MALSFEQKFTAWKLLSSALKQRLAELPELTEAHAELEGLIAEAEVVLRDQEAARGEAQRQTRQRKELEARGEELRQRLFAALQFKIGFKDELLMAFGIRPRRFRRRRKPEEERKVAAPAGPPQSTPQ